MIHSLGNGSGFKVQSVSLLGSSGAVHFTQKSDGLHLDLPGQAPGDYAYSFKISPGGA